MGAVVLLGLAGVVGAYRAQASTSAGALFLRKNLSAVSNDQTNSISVGVDSAGGMHAGFVNFSTDNSGNYHAYYDFCAAGADCANAANWSLVNLLTIDSDTQTMEDAQLQVNPQGHPRMIIVYEDNDDPFLDHYNYAACDSGCTSAGNWTVVDVAQATLGANTFIHEGNKHFFALDPQGKPRFILDNGSNYVYVFCDTGCTTAGNWSALQLNAASGGEMGFNTAALAFNSTGHPRMLASVTDESFHVNLNYLECNASDCATNANSWSSGPIISPISGEQAVYSSLRLTQAGQPRFAYYGTFAGAGETLFYMVCHSGCTTAANWTHRSVGLVPAHDFDSSGKSPDLALDSADHPRLSFQVLEASLGHGLGYAWCDANCEAAGATWGKAMVDTNDQMNADWDRTTAGCDINTWIGGYRSSLVLDAAGNPRIGHDAEHYTSLCTVPILNDVDYRSVRFVYFPQGSLPSEHKVFVPLVYR
jgi:hypothetical protein